MSCRAGPTGLFRSRLAIAIFLVFVESGCCNVASMGPPLATFVYRICIPMTGIEMCEPLGYEGITLPNARGHVNKTQANEELEDFQELVDSGCSFYLRHFLCSYYAPLCEVFLPPDLQILPCKELCTHVRTRCEPLMVSNGYSWPEHLQCEVFPNKTQAPWCFGPDNSSLINEDITATTKAATPSTDTSDPTMTIPSIQPSITSTGSTTTDHAPLPTPTPPSPSTPTCDTLPSDSICTNLPYSDTTYPNIMGHSTKQEAEQQLKASFNIAILYSCSPHFVPLLCHYYHPQCDNSTGATIPPCQELCTEVVSKCNSSITRWPKHFNCTALPSITDDSAVKCTMGSDISISNNWPSVTPTIEGAAKGGSATVSNSSTMVLSIALLLLFMIINLL